MDQVEHAARAIYDTLSEAGHGFRANAAHSPHRPSFEQLPAKWQREYRAAARAALQPPLFGGLADAGGVVVHRAVRPHDPGIG